MLSSFRDSSQPPSQSSFFSGFTNFSPVCIVYCCCGIFLSFSLFDLGLWLQMLAEGCHPPEKTFGGGSNVLCGAVQLKQTHTLSEKSHQPQVSTGKNRWWVATCDWVRSCLIGLPVMCIAILTYQIKRGPQITSFNSRDTWNLIEPNLTKNLGKKKILD